LEITPFEGIDFIPAQYNPLNEFVLVVVHLPKGFTSSTPFNLTLEEYAKAASFFQTEDAENYKWRHHLLNTWLSYYTGLPAGHLNLIKNSEGKPSFQTGGIHFNISRSGEYIAMAFGPDPIGVDIETIRDTTPFLPVAAQHFHPNEKQMLLDDSSVERAFFTIWTRKEALLKSIGSGLTDELYMIDTGMSYYKLNTKRYSMNTYRGEGFIVSLAIEGKEEKLPVLCSYSITENSIKN
jgi:4'-phosphopantetheinyl transferase